GTEDALQLAAESVAAHPSHHRHAGAEPGRRHRLVGPLAAGVRREVGAAQRLPRPRKRIRFHDEVHVQAADDEDAGHFRWRFEFHEPCQRFPIRRKGFLLLCRAASSAISGRRVATLANAKPRFRDARRRYSRRSLSASKTETRAVSDSTSTSESTGGSAPPATWTPRRSPPLSIHTTLKAPSGSGTRIFAVPRRAGPVARSAAAS